MGKHLRLYKGHYIPVVSLKRAVVQCITPKKNTSGLEGQRAWMERARGLAVTSLYWHAELFELAQDQYRRMAESGIRPATTFDGELSNESDLEALGGVGTELIFPDDSFPTRNYIVSMYMPMGAQAPGVAAPGVEAKPKPPIQVAKHKSAAEEFAAFYALDEDGPKDWADDVPEAAMLKEVVLRETHKIDLPPVVAVNRAAQQHDVPPLDPRVKEAYNAARRAALARMRAARVDKKLNRRGRLVKLLEDPADRTVVFTADGIKREFEEAAEQEIVDQALAVDEGEEYDEHEAYLDTLNDDQLDEYLTKRSVRRVRMTVKGKTVNVRNDES